MVPQGRVHVDDKGSLVWPVMFLYPEYQVTDFIQEFHEDETLVFWFLLWSFAQFYSANYFAAVWASITEELSFYVPQYKVQFSVLSY